MSIHPEVGPAVARDEDTVDYLLQILGEVGSFMALREQERGEGMRERGNRQGERKRQKNNPTHIRIFTRIHAH